MTGNKRGLASLSARRDHACAFTMIELIVSIAIFAFMTALTVAKYGTFNQSVLLSNLAYEIAANIRTAQTYGVSVKGAVSGLDSAKFQNPYAVEFSSVDGSNTTFTLFADIVKDNAYDPAADELVKKSSLVRGATVSGLCAGNTGNCSPVSGKNLVILFMRPDPNAIICLSPSDCDYSYTAIEVKGTDGSTRLVTVRENGLISVSN